jgi:hypothetical protein
MPHKKKNVQNMKPLEIDPCPNCLYGKNRNQHNVPTRVENFNRVRPKEAFGATYKKGVKKPKKPKPGKPKPKPKPYKPKY